MACAYLRSRQQAGRLDLRILPGSLDDLALDCIADLFERAPDGSFPELQRYFEGVDIEAMDRPAAMAALRRLVFSAAGDRLFDCYRAADPSLGRVIRTVKRTVREMDDARLQRHAGRLHVCSPAVRSITQALLLSPERLEAMLTTHVADSACTRDLVRASVGVLRDTTAAFQYPVSRLALAIRGATVRVGDADAAAPDVVEVRSDGFRREELQRFVERSAREVQQAKRSSYVPTGKLQARRYAAYFDAIADYLCAQYLPPGRPSLTHYEALQEHLDVTRAEYRDAHRHVFEYLLRQVRAAFVEKARKAWANGPGPQVDASDRASSRVQQGSAVGRSH